MTRRNKLQATALVLVLGSTTGCAAMSGAWDSMTGLFSSENSAGPSQVSNLVGRIEEVYVDAELSKQKLRTAADALDVIARGGFKGDPSVAYATLVKAIEDSEAQATKLRESYEPLKDQALPFFQEWTDNLKNFTNPDLRLRSQTRLANTRQRYEAIVAAVEPALVDYDTINKGLRDYSLFLGHDLNPASLNEIRNGVNALTARASQIERGFDSCLVACRAYVDAAALPVQPANQPVNAVPVSGSRPVAPEQKVVAPQPEPKKQDDPQPHTVGGQR